MTNSGHFPDHALKRLALHYHQTGLYAKALKAYRCALLLFPEDASISYNLGHLFTTLAQPHKAIACYELALRLKADDTASLSNLAQLYRRQGERRKARALYERLCALEPENSTAAYFASALKDTAPPQPPQAYIRELFDRYATEFDTHVRTSLRYQGPERLWEFLRERAPWLPLFERGIDLGCGTGLAAQTFAPLARTWVGVDLSPQMLEEAGNKRIYDELIVDDAIAYLARQQNISFCLAADFLPYIGDLTPFFAAFANATQPGAHLLISTEHCATHYEMQLNGRYAHAFAYVLACCRATGLQLIAHRLATLRHEAGEALTAGLFYIQKAGNFS